MRPAPTFRASEVIAPQPEHDRRNEGRADEIAKAAGDDDAEDDEQVIADEGAGDADQRSGDHAAPLGEPPAVAGEAIERKRNSDADENNNEQRSQSASIHDLVLPDCPG